MEGRYCSCCKNCEWYDESYSEDDPNWVLHCPIIDKWWELGDIDSIINAEGCKSYVYE